jgi:hypothetical protein
MVKPMTKPEIKFEWVDEGHFDGPELYISINGKRLGSVRDESTWKKAIKIFYAAGYKDGGDAMEQLLRV